MYVPNLKTIYKEQVMPHLKDQLGITNPMQVPKITKVTLNIGLGEAVRNKQAIAICQRDLELISGQKPLVTKARKSIAGFKIRTGFVIGMKVTMRNNRMYEFLERLLNIALPRIRDFKGLKSNSFDGRGSFTIGIREYICFPEINYDTIDRLRGMSITVTTSAKNDAEALLLLDTIGFPFKKAS